MTNTVPQPQHFTQDQVTRLKEIVEEGTTALREIEDMKQGLSDTIKEIANEMGIKPAQLSKAIKICFKNNLHEERAKFDEIIDIIDAVGRGDGV